MHLLPNMLNRRPPDRQHRRGGSRGGNNDPEKYGDIGRSGSQRANFMNTANFDLDSAALAAAFAVEPTKVYRLLPIFSGIMIPFSIMLSIPSLTGHWYIRTGENSVTIETRANPVLLDVAMAFSMACGVFASACLVMRFAERQIKWMTLGSITFLTLHDLINISAVTIFGIIHRFDDGFTYGQSFWFTVCSTVASTATNVTLIIDYYRTTDFIHSGSGLTPKQRSLVIIVIILLVYVSFGSLIQAMIQDMTFINALYFTVVSIETIGFGDINSVTTKTRVFTCFYIAGGVLNIALAVALARDALLEAAVINFRSRLRTRQRERRVRTRFRAAIRWRLRSQGLPVWIHNHRHQKSRKHAQAHHAQWYKWFVRIWNGVSDRVSRETGDPAWRFLHGPRHKRLNIEALSDMQLHAAALEAGAPLVDLVPEELGITRRENTAPPPGITLSRNPTIDHGHAHLALTHIRLGGMLSLLGNFAVAQAHGTHSALPASPPDTAVNEYSYGDDDPEDGSERAKTPHGVPLTHTMTMQDDEMSMEETLEEDEKNAFYTRLAIALTLFFVFWMVGAAVFMRTEQWPFGIAAYFCFVSFTTVGYGDFAPKTPAGRSIFVVWALLGVATMTILISVISEAYSTRYKAVIKSEVYHASNIHAGDDKATANTNVNASRLQLSDSPSVLNMGTDQASSNGNPSSTGADAPQYARSVSRRSSLRMGPIHTNHSRNARINAVIEKKAERGADTTSGSSSSVFPRQVLEQVESLRDVMAMARMPSEEDASTKLDTLMTHLERTLQEMENAAQEALDTLTHNDS